MKIKEQLKDLGFSGHEASTYLTLLKKGPSPAGSLSKETKINRTSTYQILQKLMDKGLASYTLKGKRGLFQATNPKSLVSLQKERVKLAESLAPTLNALNIEEEEETRVYKGRKGIKVILGEVLNCKEYLTFGSGGQTLDVLKHDFLLYQKEKRRKKIKNKILLGEASRGTALETETYGQHRFVDDKFMAPSTTWVYKDVVAIFIWSDSPSCVRIKSKSVAQAYKSRFELLWKVAKK